jgi:trehalose 6-phosphate synthase
MFDPIERPSMADMPTVLPAQPFSASDRAHLIVVSNRLALPGSTQTGGLATALQGVLAERGGVWIGWSGRISEDEPTTHQDAGVTYRALDLPAELHRDYYLGYSNQVLWPLLHSRLDLVEYERSWHQAYLRANERFADEVVKHLQPDSIVWVHDYHLIPLAAQLRRRRVAQRIGFFLHTPFPAGDVARCLPWHAGILAGLKHYDLVGVQTERDAEHLLGYFRDEARDPSPPRVQAFPIGIDPAEVAADAEGKSGQAARRRLRESLAGRRLVIGVDRLDYSKGLPERFIAYGRMLERHAPLRRAVSFLQIAPVSRGEVAQYRHLKTRLDRIAGEINGRHGDADWVPLRYVAKSHPHATVTAYFREASVGLVTPLRDGMNLVAKEYVAAQAPQDPGVLVLSEFAGAARQMGSALVVNPFDTCGVADALARALQMPLKERQRRWESLMGDLETHSLPQWRDDFLDALAARAPDAGAGAQVDPPTHQTGIRQWAMR